MFGSYFRKHHATGLRFYSLCKVVVLSFISGYVTSADTANVHIFDRVAAG